MTPSSSSRVRGLGLLRHSSLLTACGALLLSVSLFLVWFVVASGPKEGLYSGWLSFDRTDRVLALLALIALGSSLLPPSRWTGVVRLLIGLCVAVLVGREMAVPPVIDPNVTLGPGPYAGLAGAILGRPRRGRGPQPGARSGSGPGRGA